MSGVYDVVICGKLAVVGAPAIADFLGVKPSMASISAESSPELDPTPPCETDTGGVGRTATATDADAVETRDLTEPGNPICDETTASDQGFRGRDYSVSAVPKRLRQSRPGSGVSDRELAGVTLFVSGWALGVRYRSFSGMLRGAVNCGGSGGAGAACRLWTFSCPIKKTSAAAAG
jgi:hypothetical protein